MSDSKKPEVHNDMVPVAINDFVMGNVIPVSLFVRLGTDKFLLVAKPGERTDPERLATYKNKQVEYLWVKKHQYGEFLKSGLQIAGMAIQNNKEMSGPKKVSLLSSIAEPVFAQLDATGIAFETYSHARQIVEATIALVENHNDLIELLESMSECSDELLRHSMAVSCVATLIGQTMKWDSRSTIEKLSLGALLHDIGKKALPPDLLKKPKAKMSYDEVQLYEQHAYKGMQMLLALGSVPDDVISIVYEHHENALGQGYPRRLRNMKIHPLARVVALADEFVNLTIKNPNFPNPKNPREALMVIEITMGQPHNKDAFKALQQIINKEGLKRVG